MKQVDPQTKASLTWAVPNWMKAVDGAKKAHVNYLLLSIDAFADDPQLMFNALWYAHDAGVAVLFAPDDRTQQMSAASPEYAGE